jgi:hypothetical protein
VIEELMVAGGLFALLFASLEVGYRLGLRHSHDADPDAAGQIGAIQGAVLGLLGLLLAFSFAAAGTRFLERQDLITAEANAIGTAYLRADLIDEPHRSELRAALRQYTEHRIGLSQRIRLGLMPADLAEIAHQHARIWSAAVAGVTARPASTLAVLSPVNELIDLHSVRIAAGRKHRIADRVLGDRDRRDRLRVRPRRGPARAADHGAGGADRHGPVDHGRSRPSARGPDPAQRCAARGADLRSARCAGHRVSPIPSRLRRAFLRRSDREQGA